MHDAFICYSAQDQAVAYAACAALEDRGIRCWIAPRDIVAGRSYAETLIDALSQSRLMVLVFSRSANSSPQVLREVKLAADKGIPIIPVRVETDMPSKPMECFALASRWLDALTQPLEKHLQRLADMVQALLDELNGSGAYVGGTPEVPGGRVDLVHFSVTSPSTVRPGYSFVVGIYAHLKKQIKEVIERAQKAVPEGERSITTQGPLRVERGTMLTVRLRIEEFIVDPAEGAILWNGEIGNVTFGVGVPQEAKRGRRVGTATISANGFQIGTIFFELHVGSRPTSVKQIRAKVRQHRTAFASYASPDRREVMKRIQGMQKAAPRLDVFVDVDSLRSGQHWWQEIQKVVPSRDVFYLFWSASASTSQWVEEEWRCALAQRGLDFIDPCPLVSPVDVPPPTELESLHFFDRWLVYEGGKESGNSG